MPRPTVSGMPGQVNFASQFALTVALPSATSASQVSVSLMDLGFATHGLLMNQRAPDRDVAPTDPSRHGRTRQLPLQRRQDTDRHRPADTSDLPARPRVGLRPRQRRAERRTAVRSPRRCPDVDSSASSSARVRTRPATFRPRATLRSTLLPTIDPISVRAPTIPFALHPAVLYTSSVHVHALQRSSIAVQSGDGLSLRIRFHSASQTRGHP